MSENVKKKRVAISIDEGRTIRDLFYNGFLDLLVESEIEVTVFTEATTVSEFIQRWNREGVEFVHLLPCPVTRARAYALHIRRSLMRSKVRPLLKGYLAFEERLLYHKRNGYAQQFNSHPPNLLVTTNPLLMRDAELISTAHVLGIPTLGLVRSWDNVHKGLQCRPQYLAVWNEINRQEVVEFNAYQPENVVPIGAPQFDPYFAADTLWSREKLAKEFNLDPARPIILFATLGYFIQGLDETCWMDLLLDQINQEIIPGRPQVICRLHPWSRFEHFKRYAEHPDVRLSYTDRYLPTLTWYMTKDDVVLVANMLKHADVVITPGSTITLEAAIFDRPTLVPIFHTYQPERARDYFTKVVFSKHFRRIEQLGLVPIIRKAEDYAPAIIRCLNEPGWYREQRAQLVRDYVHFTDGKAVERFTKLIKQLAN
jgi:hypothetical protein